MAVLAWLLFPLAATAVCTGLGLLAERAARAELEPAALPALGFAAAIAVLAPLFATGAGEAWGCALLVVLAVAGAASAVVPRGGGVRPRHTGDIQARLRPGLGAAAGGAAYVLFLAPLALSGKVTFLGYNLLNDTAIHLALVDWIGDHGSRFIAQAPSSYSAVINDYVRTRYPLGSHELLAALRPLGGLDPARLYQPFLALCAGFASAALFAVVRREGMGRVPAALAALAALAGQLVFSFALQGGIKELSFITCLAAAAAVGRDVRLLALPAAALYGIYGVYALPWIAPLGLAALVLVRPRAREAVVAVALFLVLVAVEVPDSIRYYRHGHTVITAGTELGPLAGPLKPLQAAGIWLTGDYRFTPANHAWITYVLIALVLALALVGAVTALRRRSLGPLLFLVPAFVAWAITAPKGSPYIDAKLLAVLCPALVLTACFGMRALPSRGLAIAAAVVMGGGLLVSDALAYRMALVAPVDRLEELVKIDKRFPGQGPILVNEYEEYTKHYMRRSRGSDPYEGWSAGRAQLRDQRLPVAAHAYDLDQLKTSFIERYRLIALRRSPAESRPPSNYERVWSGRFYDVWRRTGPAPSARVALGKPPLQATEPLDCKLVRNLASGGHRVVAALRPAPLIVPLERISPLPAGWRPAADPQALETNKGGTIATTFEGRGPAHLWVRGRSFRALEVRVDGRSVGSVRQLNGPNQWMDAGRVDLPPGSHRLELVRPKRSLRPGDSQADVIGPVAIAPEGPTRLVRGRALLRACGAPADWIDAL